MPLSKNFDESKLKAVLMERARTVLTGFVFFRHEDRLTAGIPDIEAVGNLSASWWEVKHANPRFKSTGIQELTMLRLEKFGGKAYYLIYDESSGKRRTIIVPPHRFKQWKEGANVEGFDHDWVVEQIKRVHHGYHEIIT